MATIQVPIRWITKKLADASERRLVEAMFDELQQTGKVEHTLPEDDFAIRDLHQKEVVGKVTARVPSVPIATAPVAAAPSTDVPTRTATPRAANGESTRPTLAAATVSELKTAAVAIPQSKPTAATPPPLPPLSAPAKKFRFYLETESPLDEAPSIGPKTAAHFEKLGIRTVADLLAAVPEIASKQIGLRHITPQLIRDWQDQSRLVCRIPELRGHDAQILVACSFRDPQTIASTDAVALLKTIEPFVESSEGESRSSLRQKARPGRSN